MTINNPPPSNDPVVQAFSGYADLSQYSDEGINSLAQNIENKTLVLGGWEEIRDTLLEYRAQGKKLDFSLLLGIIESDNPKIPKPTANSEQSYADFQDWFAGIKSDQGASAGLDAVEFANAQYVSNLLSGIKTESAANNVVVGEVTEPMDVEAAQRTFSVNMMNGSAAFLEDSLTEMKLLFNQLPENEKAVYKDLIALLDTALADLKEAINAFTRGDTTQAREKSHAKLEEDMRKIEEQKRQLEEQEKAAKKQKTFGLVMKILTPIMVVIAAALAVVTGGAMLALAIALAAIMIASMIVQETTGQSLISRAFEAVQQAVGSICDAMGVGGVFKEAICMAVKMVCVAAIVAASIAAGGNFAMAVQVCMQFVMESGIMENVGAIAKEAGAGETAQMIIQTVVMATVMIVGIAGSIGASMGASAAAVGNGLSKMGTAAFKQLPEVVQRAATQAASAIEDAVKLALSPLKSLIARMSDGVGFLTGQIDDVFQSIRGSVARSILEAAGNENKFLGLMDDAYTALRPAFEKISSVGQSISDSPLFRADDTVNAFAARGLMALQSVGAVSSATAQGYFATVQADFQTEIARIQALIEELEATIKMLKQIIQKLLDGLQGHVDWQAEIGDQINHILDSNRRAIGNFAM